MTERISSNDSSANSDSTNDSGGKKKNSTICMTAGMKCPVQRLWAQAKDAIKLEGIMPIGIARSESRPDKPATTGNNRCESITNLMQRRPRWPRVRGNDEESKAKIVLKEV